MIGAGQRLHMEWPRRMAHAKAAEAVPRRRDATHLEGGVIGGDIDGRGDLAATTGFGLRGGRGFLDGRFGHRLGLALGDSLDVEHHDFDAHARLPLAVSELAALQTTAELHVSTFTEIAHNALRPKADQRNPVGALLPLPLRVFPGVPYRDARAGDVAIDLRVPSDVPNQLDVVVPCHEKFLRCVCRLLGGVCFVPGPIPPGGRPTAGRCASPRGRSGFLQGAVLPGGDLDPCRWAAPLAGLGRQDGEALPGYGTAEERWHVQRDWLGVRRDAQWNGSTKEGLALRWARGGQWSRFSLG
jgi:hypothetical protein